MQAQKENLTLLSMSYEELYHQANKTINNAQQMTKVLMDNELIPTPPEEE